MITGGGAPASTAPPGTLERAGGLVDSWGGGESPPHDVPPVERSLSPDTPAAQPLAGHAVDIGVEAAGRAWSRLTGLPELHGLQVVVDPESPLGPRGWIAILAIGSTITASVPRLELQKPVMTGLTGLTGHEATTPEVIVERLPIARAMLGPAALYYPPPGFTPASQSAEEASRQELSMLCAAVNAEELDESGLAHIDSPAFASRSFDGALAAACGYRRWANGVAHLSALTHPAHRRQGHGHRAATIAISDASMTSSRSGERAPSHPDTWPRRSG